MATLPGSLCELLKKVSYKRSAELMADVKAIFKGDDVAECLRRGEEVGGAGEDEPCGVEDAA